MREAPGHQSARHFYIRLENTEGNSIAENESESEHRVCVLVVVRNGNYL